MLVEVSSLISLGNVMCLAARTIFKAVLSQFAYEITLAVDISPNQIYPAVIILEELSVLGSRMLGGSYVQSVDITEFSIDVICYANHLPVVLHRYEEGQVHNHLPVDKSRTGSPVVYPGSCTCLHRVLLSVAERIIG